MSFKELKKFFDKVTSWPQLISKVLFAYLESIKALIACYREVTICLTTYLEFIKVLGKYSTVYVSIDTFTYQVYVSNICAFNF